MWTSQEHLHRIQAAAIEADADECISVQYQHDLVRSDPEWNPNRISRTSRTSIGGTSKGITL
jgi:hypothetical protein